MNRFKYILLLCVCALGVNAQDNLSALLPMPQKVELKQGKTFDFGKVGAIDCSMSDSLFTLEELKDIVAVRTGIQLPVDGSNRIVIKENSDALPESYTIDIDRKCITIEGSRSGIYYALKTLDQLLLGDATNSAQGKAAPVRIDDAPRYGYRAVMLDPARHFLPVDDVKFFIDQMAKYKYNVLQLHLTDDQGWRVEIKSHPMLTQVGAHRNPHGGDNGPDNGFYTQEQLKELVSYAAARNVEIVP